MPLDYAGLTISRLWALLEADSTWAGLVRPVNRIKRVNVDNARPGNVANNLGHFPQLDIRLSGGTGNAFATGATKTFGQCSFILVATRQVLLVYTVDETRYDVADDLIARTEFILCSAGADLGLPSWCSVWGPYQWTRREVTVDASAPVVPGQTRKRIEDTMSLTVNYRIPKATLLA
jgi:hypothetical protein